VNAYQQLQSSGIHWPERAPGLLYQPFQAAPRWSEPHQNASILEGLERQMAEFSAQHDADLREVGQRYVLPPDSSVITFLTKHRTLPPILLEAVPHLEACFGAHAVFTLRAPIDDSGSQTLYAVAIWPGNLREVREALEKFDDTWWIHHSREASGYLTFTYELV
jgi:hypothetical protein